MTTQKRLPESPRLIIPAHGHPGKAIYKQNEPILDLKLLDEGLLVLDSLSLALYRRRNDDWELETLGFF